VQEERGRSPWCKARRVVDVVCKPFVGAKIDERRIEVSSEVVIMLPRSVCLLRVVAYSVSKKDME